MDKEVFKRIVDSCLKDFGFYKYKTWYYLDVGELFIGVKLMRSYYGEIYYIDYGIFVKRRYIGNDYKNRNPYDAEIRSRIDGCEIAQYDEVKYEKFLKKRIRKLFSNLTTEEKLKKQIRRNADRFFLFMPSLEEKCEWSPMWRKLAAK